MRRIILMALTALTLTGGVAMADRDGRHGGWVREHRGDSFRNDRRDNGWRHNNGWRNNNGWRQRNDNVRYSRYRDYDRSRYNVVRVNRSDANDGQHEDHERNSQWQSLAGTR